MGINHTEVYYGKHTKQHRYLHSIVHRVSCIKASGGNHMVMVVGVVSRMDSHCTFLVISTPLRSGRDGTK